MHSLTERQELASLELSQALQDITAIQQAVIEKFYTAAHPAADLLISKISKDYQKPADPFALAVERFQADNAKHILKLAGLEVERQHHSGKVGFEPLKISRGENV